ncbi:MAG: hypothetical protein QOJ51_761 [Acidobacteriaceae bacterium]|jgi:hypothetical protein|nr:hypothetical protein [Acidobacteriaceae bacterium]MEA2257936.1 hypothetical protein [Acidobacteriaceae bacterium]
MLPAHGVPQPQTAINLVNRLKRPNFINFYQLPRTKDLSPAGISTIQRIGNGAFCAFCALLGGLASPLLQGIVATKSNPWNLPKNPSLPISGETSVLTPFHGKNFVRRARP